MGRHECRYCHEIFKCLAFLEEHIESCPLKVEEDPNDFGDKDQLIASLRKQLQNLNNRPRIYKESYLDRLIPLFDNNSDIAYRFIQDCATAGLVGDLRMLDKVYLSDGSLEYPVKILDKRQKKLEFYDQNYNRIIDNGMELNNILCDNLQKCYLKSVNHGINKNMDNTETLFDNFDIPTMQKHICNLSDKKYRLQLLDNFMDIVSE